MYIVVDILASPMIALFYIIITVTVVCSRTKLYFKQNKFIKKKKMTIYEYAKMITFYFMLLYVHR